MKQTDLLDWFPIGTKLTVMDVSADGRICVRWKLEIDPTMTNEATLQVALPAAREKALKKDASADCQG